MLYHIVLSNTGPADQADLAGDELVDVLPPELILVDATASSGTVAGQRRHQHRDLERRGGGRRHGRDRHRSDPRPGGAGRRFDHATRRASAGTADGDGTKRSDRHRPTIRPRAAAPIPPVFVVGGAEQVVDVPILDHRGLPGPGGPDRRGGGLPPAALSARQRNEERAGRPRGRPALFSEATFKASETKRDDRGLRKGRAGPAGAGDDAAADAEGSCTGSGLVPALEPPLQKTDR